MNNCSDPARAALDTAVAAAKAAGSLLRDEFNRPSGPRGHGGHAEADEAAEKLIHDRLREAFPGDGYLGEELGPQNLRPNPCGRLWVVDPNDGTRAYLKGFRGSAVSIALLENGKPILGVVYAFNHPDDNGDLIAWAQGAPLTRNASPVARSWPEKPSTDCTVLVSQSADKNPGANARCAHPMRYRAMPSIAYRLALTAVGDGNAAVSLNDPTSWDLAGGHALLIGAGADLYRSDGSPVRYSAGGDCNPGRFFFGGPKALVDHIRVRDWQSVFERSDEESPLPLCRPMHPEGSVDAGMLSRAHGCLLGQVAGDALGSLVEFQGPGEIKAEYPGALRSLADGGTWDTIAGQPTDDTELALMLARSLVQKGFYDADSALAAYKFWLSSRPFDIGITISAALGGRLNHASQANGALMRVSPLGVLGAGHGLDQAASWAEQDAALTHPHPVCKQINALFAMAVARSVRTGESPRTLYQNTLKWATDRQADASILNAIRLASDEPPQDYTRHQGWVLIAFQNALYQLLHADSVEQGVVDTVMQGGDTDTNAAICGALLGAVHGRDSVPRQWQDRVLTCRPLADRPGVHRPRPQCFWPVDALILAERLLQGGR